MRGWNKGVEVELAPADRASALATGRGMAKMKAPGYIGDALHVAEKSPPTATRFQSLDTSFGLRFEPASEEGITVGGHAPIASATHPMPSASSFAREGVPVATSQPLIA